MEPSKRAEAFASEPRLGPLADYVSDLVFVARVDGNDEYSLVDVNQAYLDLVGAPKEQLLGTRVDDLLPPEGAAYVKSRYGEALAKREAIRYEEDVRLPDGRRLVFDVLLTPIFDVRGGVHLLGTGRNITGQRIAEDALRKREEQSLQARKMEAVGLLAAGIAHDFNNVLTAIRGYADLLLADLPTGDAHRRDVQAIAEAAERAESLTRQLLAFSRQQVLQPRKIDLGELVAGLEPLLRRLLPENINLRVRSAGDLWPTLADPGELEHVILNLALNARDAMPDGGALTIETANVQLDAKYANTHPDVDPGPYVVLAVSDTGVGMDAETQARIFEPFFTTKARGHGTGLGLSSAYGTIRQSGGTIWVYSEPGRGTTFKVYLPRTSGVPEPRNEPAPRLAVQGGAETVLVVEDNDAVRGLTRQVLRRHGYEVVEARHAEDALAASRSYPGDIALLITDVVLPGMSGRVLSETLARERPGLRVLYVSGYTEDTIAHHGAFDAEVAFLEKPFTPAALAERVRHIIDARSETAGAVR